MGPSGQWWRCLWSLGARVGPLLSQGRRPCGVRVQGHSDREGQATRRPGRRFLPRRSVPGRGCLARGSRVTWWGAPPHLHGETQISRAVGALLLARKSRMLQLAFSYFLVLSTGLSRQFPCPPSLEIWSYSSGDNTVALKYVHQVLRFLPFERWRLISSLECGWAWRLPFDEWGTAERRR